MKGRLILIAPEEQETLRYFWQKHPTGFTWWADRHAQTVEVTGSESDVDGGTAYSDF
jgi:hypothetical protein